MTVHRIFCESCPRAYPDREDEFFITKHLADGRMRPPEGYGWRIAGVTGTQMNGVAIVAIVWTRTVYKPYPDEELRKMGLKP